MERTDGDALVARKEAIANAMERRRMEQIERASHSGQTSQSEIVRKILRDFEASQRMLTAELDELVAASPQGSELSNALDAVASKLHEEEKSLSQHSNILPQYELRRAQQLVTGLQIRLRDVQDDLQPKKKFGFKGKKSKITPAPVIRTHNGDDDRPEPEEQGPTGCVVKNEKGKTIKLAKIDTDQKDVSLHKLEGCEVHIFGNPSTLHMTSMEGCLVLSGPISTSVFIDDSKKCTFALACQQLRIHNVEETDFYLHVTSRAIIEDTKKVRFGPLCLKYPGLNDDYTDSGLDLSVNNWDQIDDFNWLAMDQHSPNWSIIDVDERRTFKTCDQ